MDDPITLRRKLFSRSPSLLETILIIALLSISFATFLRQHPRHIIIHKAFTDGLSVEDLPSTSVENRQLSFYVSKSSYLDYCDRA
jgi:hypothetical protein